MSSKPTSGNIVLRRSGRVVKRTGKYDLAQIENEAPLQGVKSGKKHNPVSKSSALSDMNTTQPSNENCDTAFEQKKGRLVYSIPNSMKSGRRRDPFLSINPGNFNDPIDVDALPSPPPPDRFVGRSVNYYNPFPLQYRPSRPNTPPILLTPNGAQILSGKVSGHQSHDIYKSYVDMRDVPAPPGFLNSCARLTAEIYASRSHSRQPSQDTNILSTYTKEYGIGSDNISVQPYGYHLQRGFPSYPPDYRTHTASYRTPVHGYPIFPVLHEESLRQRAVQFVLDHSRPRPRKRRLSDDPDATSSSEYEGGSEQLKRKVKKSPLIGRVATPPQPSGGTRVSTPSTGISEDNIYDRNSKLAELIEHMQLLTAMLMTYPRAADQEGIREDISMLATVADKRLSSWVSAESDFDEVTRQRLILANTPSSDTFKPADMIAGGTRKSTDQMKNQAKQIAKKQKEDAVRKYLSADSELWGKESRKKMAVEDEDDVSGRDENRSSV